MRSGATAVMLLAVVAGCATPPPADPDRPDAWRATACEHPWPCGDGSEWPLDLVTPPDGFVFSGSPMPLRIPMDDGIELDAGVWIPDLPEGVRPPVVIWATPYAGQCRYSEFIEIADADPGTAPPGCDEDASSANDFAADVFAFLLQEGYAAAHVSMRGTGLSGGCFDLYGPRGQQDMAAMAQWFGEQEWTNGRVAMWGVSAMGTTPFMAAIGAPPALKTIAPSGIITDLYLNRFTPQGAPDLTGGSFHAGWSAFNSLEPSLGTVRHRFVEEYPAAVPHMVEGAATRYCEDVPETLTSGATSQHSDDRNAQFWEDRRLVSRFGDITAAVFVLSGMHDYGHAWQDDTYWAALMNAPKRQISGPWGHEHVFNNTLGAYVGGNSTERLYVEWFDFWLKGRGDPPRLGVVDHESTDGTWRESAAWPPPEAREELLYLAGGSLAEEPGAAGTFRASAATNPPPCGLGQDPPSQGALVLESAPLGRTTIAGNPYAYLELTSGEAGGTFALTIYDLDQSGACVGLLSEGGVDLRFHEGNMRGEDFPINTPTPVRVDLFGTAHAVEAGHKLRVVFSMGESGTVSQAQYAPEITIGGASHIVFPLVEGTVGGAAPALEYPARPR